MTKIKKANDTRKCVIKSKLKFQNRLEAAQIEN